MNDPEILIIPKGAAINEGNGEDDDIGYAKESLIAFRAGPTENGAIPVIIPLIPDRVLYYHQPEKSITKASQ